MIWFAMFTVFCFLSGVLISTFIKSVWSRTAAVLLMSFLLSLIFLFIAQGGYSYTKAEYKILMIFYGVMMIYAQFLQVGGILLRDPIGEVFKG